MTEQYHEKDGDITIHHKDKRKPGQHGMRGNQELVRKRLRPVIRKLEGYRLRNSLSMGAMSELLGLHHRTYGTYVSETTIPWMSTVDDLKTKLRNLLEMERTLDKKQAVKAGASRWQHREPRVKAHDEATMRPLLKEIEALRRASGTHVADVVAMLGTSEFSYYAWRDGRTPMPRWLPIIQSTLETLRAKVTEGTLKIVQENLAKGSPNIVSSEVADAVTKSREELGLANPSVGEVLTKLACLDDKLIPSSSENPPLQEQRVHYRQLICKDCGADIKIGSKLKSANECPLCGSARIRVAVERVVTEVKWVDREE